MSGASSNCVIIRVCLLLSWLALADVGTQSSDACRPTDSPAQTQDQEPPYIYVPGAPVILITIPAYDERDGNWNCKTLRSQGGVFSEASLYSVDRIRQLTGIYFGVLIIGLCHNIPSNDRLVYSIMSGDRVIKGRAKDGSITELDPSTIIVGMSGQSEITVGLQNILGPLNVVGLTYSSTTPILDDKKKYPYFLRTVPSDVKQADAIIQILKAINTTAFQLISTPDAYGSEGAELVRTFASKNGLCITNDLEMKDEPGALDLSQTLQNVLKNGEMTGAKAVVYFGREFVSETLIQSLLSEPSLSKDWKEQGMVFVGSDAWANPTQYQELNWEGVLIGSFALRLETIFKINSSVGEGDANDFPSYLKNKPFVRDSYSVFLNTSLAPYCNSELLRQSPNITVFDMVDLSSMDSSVIYLVETVFIIGYAFKKLSEENECVRRMSQGKDVTCENFATDFYHRLQRATIPSNSYSKNGETISPFEKGGRNGNLGYIVMQVGQLASEGHYQKTVFNINALDGRVQPESQLLFRTQKEGSLPTVHLTFSSSCGETCPEQCLESRTSTVQCPEGPKRTNTVAHPGSDPIVLTILGLVCLQVVLGVFHLPNRICCRRHPH